MTTSYPDIYKHGDYNAICDVCGWKYKASELKRRWDGRMVCENDFELRHSLDKARQLGESLTIPYVAPESTDQFVEVTYAASTVGVQENTIPSGTFDNGL